MKTCRGKHLNRRRRRRRRMVKTKIKAAAANNVLLPWVENSLAFFNLHKIVSVGILAHLNQVCLWGPMSVRNGPVAIRAAALHMA